MRVGVGVRHERDIMRGEMSVIDKVLGRMLSAFTAMRREILGETGMTMTDDLSAKATGIGTMKVKMFDGVVRTLANVSGFMEVKRGALLDMKGEKVKNLYKLIGKTVVGGAVRVEPCQERSSSVAQEVARVK
ncbi:hypothetical protein TIFTF001_030643 [Ficus carica]|uniref:Uncharacterized protein n=1 Tax=Ficus carica TaxID=3494 RepID=A0AA88DUK4_FICCA|nr:hypothetical protein TIFTF001_030643 [Ficus carica]